MIRTGIGVSHKLRDGLLTCREVISSCYGPRGTAVLMESFGRRYLTKYGSQILRELVLEDKIEDIARRSLADVAVKIEGLSGDGTKTAILLQTYLYTGMYKLLIGGIDEGKILESLRQVKSDIINHVKDLTLKVDIESLKYLISTRIDNKPLADLVEEAYLRSGKGTLISVGDSKSVDSYLDFREGYYTDEIYVSDKSLNGNINLSLDGCLVAVTHLPILKAEDISSFLQFASKHPMLIIAPYIEGEALKTFWINKGKGLIDGVLIGCFSEDIRNDIAAICGASILTRYDMQKQDDFDVELLGSCRNVDVTKNRIEILSHIDKEDAVASYTEKLRNEMETTPYSYIKRNLVTRLAKISGGICRINVGSYTELERRDKRAVLEKTLTSLSTALKTGVIPGGWASVISAYQVLKIKYADDPINIACLDMFLGPIACLCKEKIGYVKSMLDRYAGEFRDWDGVDVAMNGYYLRSFKASPMILDSFGGFLQIIETATSSASELIKTSTYISKPNRGNNGKTKR